MSDRPPFVVRSADVPEVESAYPAPFDAEKLSFCRELGRAAGTRTLGARRERLPPGRRTSFTHAHLREEELVYVLSGSPSVRWIEVSGDTHEIELAPGDFVAFPAGTGIAHTFWNRTSDDAELFVVGERRTSERVWYPEDPQYGARVERSPLVAWSDVAGPTGQGTWPAVHIETERLTMRPWERADVQELIAAQQRNQEHLVPFMPWAINLPTENEMLARIIEWQRLLGIGRDVLYGVFDHEQQIVGGTGLHDRVGDLGRELGYWIDKDQHGKGFVTEWCAALVRIGFDVLLLDRLEIHCEPANERSSAVARRLGFVHEATLPRRVVGTDGLPRDSMVFSLYARDYQGSALSRTPVRAWDGAGRRLL